MLPTKNQIAALPTILLLPFGLISCTISIGLLLWGLIKAGPEFYNGRECEMTYSRFQFLPLRVVASADSEVTQTDHSQGPLFGEEEVSNNRYRLMKFTDARDPRHRHFYPISGSLIENYDTQSNPRNKQQKNPGRFLELKDNWCLLPPDEKVEHVQNVPHPYRGHPVLYVPGHWGSFSQARSIGAHGTRWAGPYPKGSSDQEIYQQLYTGKDMHDGIISNDITEGSAREVVDAILSSQELLDDFVMDVFALDFDGGEGGALHSSKLLRQAEFFAKAVATIIQACNIGESKGGITIVAHSIGAWVVRIALKMHPHLVSRGWIRNVITLASPLGGLPYAVDAGVHDIIKHLNEDINDQDGDVCIISISGGLRDEMIPPESCAIPPSVVESNDVVSDTILASTMLGAKTNPVGHQSIKDSFGMDHRAIVWCYDQLKIVRELIFALVVSTDRGIEGKVRQYISKQIMLGDLKAFESFHSEVLAQRNRFIEQNSYYNAVAIQLAAPYHLNSLLKLIVLSALLHSFLIRPFCQRRWKESALNGGTEVVGFEAGLSAVATLITVFLCFFLRQLEFSRILPGKSCNNHECQLLFGTVFVLTQLATAFHFIILYGAIPFIRTLRLWMRKRVLNKGNYERECPPMDLSFGSIMSCRLMEGSRLLTFVFPCTFLTVWIIRMFMLAHGDQIAWNSTSAASFLFLSSNFVIAIVIIAAATDPTFSHHRQFQSIMIAFLVLLVKSTFGKVLYAFSSTTNWGQMDNHLYDNFLKAMNTAVGTVGGHHYELLLCSIFSLIPIFTVVEAMKTYVTIVGNSKLLWENIVTKNSTSEPDEKLLCAVDILSSRFCVPRILSAAEFGVICWYAWYIFVSCSSDDVILPCLAGLCFWLIYLNCRTVSPAALRAYSAILENDLLLQSDFPMDHTKLE
ncbi:hypothetical protein ACHAXS_009137 [Conticribra weissflogii]